MRFTIVVLTYEAERLGRFGLLCQTMESLCLEFPDDAHLLFSNGGESSEQMWQELIDSRFLYMEQGRTRLVRTAGAGRNSALQVVENERLMSSSPGSIIVMSDDDMRWKPGARTTLERFWSEAPDDVVIACGLLEPDYDWNKPRGVVEAGGVRALVRDSAPAAAWSFRWRDRRLIFPLSEAPGSEDTEACVKLRQQGKRIVQLDLCTHEGADVSTHNNRPMGRPLDRARWGI